jgi:hypothetical protein
MNKQRRNNSVVSGTLLGTANPKVVAATILLIIMMSLWARVLLRGRSGPARANAQDSPSVVQPVTSTEKKILIQPVSLPVIAGRHDRLMSDPFILNRARWFGKTDEASQMPAGTQTKDAAEQKHWTNLQAISQRLVLEAVVAGPDGVPIKACVNGTVLFKGSMIKVKENGELYDLKVTEVSASEIKLVWQVYTLTIKMPSSEWLD